MKLANTGLKLLSFNRFIIGVLLLSGTLSSSGQPGAGLYPPGDKFRDILMLLDMVYVDSLAIQEAEETAIFEMLKSLDPHSEYFTTKEMEAISEEMDGNFEGIGIQFQVFRDTILVISTITGGPSEKAGLMAGDKIIAINGENATGPKVDNQYVFDRLRGTKGTQVDISIKRGSRPDPVDFTITRGEIPLSSIDAAFMADKKTGYIRLNRFAKNSLPLYHEEFEKLLKSGMEQLILDLRDNAGGYLQGAVELADEFLPSGKTIVYTEGNKSSRKTYNASKMGGFEKGKVVVLIDEGSASASEIVAGALQDWDRGFIIGRRSFGKGLVQQEFMLDDGSAVRITTARYFTPAGRCIQKPYDGNYDNYLMELDTRFSNGELLHPDSIHFPDSLKYFTPSGKVVYGGGGIMPDHFIPLDTSDFPDYLLELTRLGIINDFILDFMDGNRRAMTEAYPEINGYIKRFVPGEKLMDELMAFALVKGLESQSIDEKTRNIISGQLKALIARNLFGLTAYFQVEASKDPAVLKALEVMGQK